MEWKSRLLGTTDGSQDRVGLVRQTERGRWWCWRCCLSDDPSLSGLLWMVQRSGREKMAAVSYATDGWPAALPHDGRNTNRDAKVHPNLISKACFIVGQAVDRSMAFCARSDSDYRSLTKAISAVSVIASAIQTWRETRGLWQQGYSL